MGHLVRSADVGDLGRAPVGSLLVEQDAWCEKWRHLRVREGESHMKQNQYEKKRAIGFQDKKGSKKRLMRYANTIKR